MRISKREVQDALLDSEVVEKTMRMILKESPNITREDLTEKIDKVACGGMGGASHPKTIEDLMRAELKTRG